MHIHILGIGGTFMSALAVLAKQKGYRVTGHDAACYPPISDLLQAHGIDYVEGYDSIGLMLQADEVVVGNAMKRGLPIVEALLNHGKHYVSGPEWLAREVLAHYKVLAVCGTHGKTSTSTIIAYILSEAGLKPSYLIGGVPQALPANAKMDDGEWFVIEADEYDTAFFDKRPKFMHYRPQGVVMHNLEFDHADIYDSLAAIQKQFHFLLRTVPGQGWVVRPEIESGIDGAMQMGVYSPLTRWGYSQHADAQLLQVAEDGSAFTLQSMMQSARVEWSLLGMHNVENACAAMIACQKLGVSLEQSAKILATYQPVKRRLEVCLSQPDLTVYDDFAHHPTAIRRASQAVALSGKHQRLLAILEFGSNSMRGGHHLQHIGEALQYVDELYVVKVKDFDILAESASWPCRVHVFEHVDALVEQIIQDRQPKDAILMMSNKGFDQLKKKLLEQLQAYV
jgi:UDP-N-acetylmuramate: L-alanyl-gamma-D-glutamyl-meso-diaminopimelate ligase